MKNILGTLPNKPFLIRVKSQVLKVVSPEQEAEWALTVTWGKGMNPFVLIFLWSEMQGYAAVSQKFNDWKSYEHKLLSGLGWISDTGHKYHVHNMQMCI